MGQTCYSYCDYHKPAEQKMKSPRITAASLVIAGLLSPALVSAAMIAFEVVPPNGVIVSAAPYTEAGFTLTDTNPTYDAIFGANGPSGSNSNGSAIFGWCGSCTPITQIITLAATGGGVFSLAAFDAANLDFQNSSKPLTLEGDLHAGGIVTQTVSINDTWTTFALSGFENIDRIRIFGPNLGFNFAMDNLAVSVPEPGAGALLGLGLIGLLASRRRID